jgi:uncharacterized protein YigA (DUF484 family)
MTGKPAKGSEQDGGPSAAQVDSYLRRHPDFLARHPELLKILTPPDCRRRDGVLDLQSYMVDRLRDEVAEITAARDAVVQAGRGNLTAQSRTHQAVLALLAAHSFEHLIEIVTTDLAVALDLDAVTLGVERSAQGLPPVRVGGLYQLEPDTVDSVIGPGRALLLRSEIEGDPMIFGAGAGLVASEALIRLSISAATPSALLALGSRRPDQFHPGQGTELLTFLAGALEQCVRAWLELPG